MVSMDGYAIAQVEKTFNKPVVSLLTYGVTLDELVEYVTTDKPILEFSYEMQCCVFDLFPRWYIAQTPFRFEIYPDCVGTDWNIVLKFWENLGKFFDKRS